MPDSDKTPGQAVQEESANKFHRRDDDGFCFLLLSVFGAKGDYAVFKLFDAAVGNGHSCPWGIAVARPIPVP